MTEAARCPTCHWGRLTYPLEIERQQCVGCMGKRNRVNTGLARAVYRSEDNMYRQQGVLDDD